MLSSGTSTRQGLAPHPGSWVLTTRDGRFSPSSRAGPAWGRVDRDALVVSAARLVRSYHHLVVDWSYPAGGWQRALGAEEGGDVICHNDLAPWNFLCEDNTVTGLVDWDVAAPGMLTVGCLSPLPKTEPPWAARPTLP